MIKNIGTIEAILAINPDAQVTVSTSHDGSITTDWKDTSEISQSDIDAKIIELQAEYDAQAYARTRSEAYDSVGNQLDMLMKDMRDGTKTHQESCEAVKAKYPK